MRIGLDMLEEARMERLIPNGRFMERVFTDGERDYIFSKGRNAAQTAAGLFCAKEAYAKACGRGIGVILGGMPEIAHDEYGQPYFDIEGSSVSITHTGGIAAAVVVLPEQAK